MKPITIVFIILYLIIFSFAGVWFYFKYAKGSANSSVSTQTMTLTQTNTILYSVNNNLYQLDTNNTNQSSSNIRSYPLQSTGKIQSLTIDPQNEFLVYSNLSALNVSEIWQMIFKDNHLEKIFSPATPGFETYTNFRSPVISKTENKMAFLATNAGADDIFIWDMASNSTQNLTLKTIKEPITSMDWSATEAKIYFATFSNDKASFNSIDLSQKLTNLFLGINKMTQLKTLKDKTVVMYLDSNNTANLGTLNLASSSQIKPITDLKTPSTVVNFDLSLTGTQIVYQTNETLNKTNDLYLINTDGTNLLQLTTDGKSEFPVLSPDGKKIVFYQSGSGIYTMGIYKDNKTKILNSESAIDNILIWR